MLLVFKQQNSLQQTHGKIMITRFFIGLFSTLLFITISVQASNRLIIISDEDNCESPQHNATPKEALTNTLAYFIKEDIAPILVSRSVLHQFIAKQIGTASFLKKIQLCRVVDYQNGLNTSYYLLVPEKTYDRRITRYHQNHGIYGKEKALGSMFGLQASATKKIILTEPDFKTSLLQTIAADSQKHSVGLAGEFWQSLFLKKNDSGTEAELLNPWLIMLFCHGSTGSLSGLSIETLHSFFKFLSEEQTTKVVAMTSCLLGGITKELLCTDALGDPIVYNFDFIVAGLSDIPLTINRTANGLATKFFIEYYSKQTPDTEEAIRIFTELIVPMDESFPSFGQIQNSGSSTGFNVPNNAGHYTKLTPSKMISRNAQDTSLIPIAPQTPSASNTDIHNQLTPLQVVKSKAILAYTERCPRPLTIHPALNDQSGRAKSPIVCTDNYLPQLTKIASETIDRIRYPATALTLETIGIKSEELSEKDHLQAVQQKNCPKGFYYPNTISMKHSIDTKKSTLHIFDQITTSNIINGVASPCFGILRYLRDSFLCSGGRRSASTICIKKLYGYNDLSIIFESEQDQLASCELKGILRDNKLATGNLELEHVIITKSFSETTRTSTYHVQFSLNANQGKKGKSRCTAWNCWFTISEGTPTNIPCLWRFQKMNFKDHLATFERQISNKPTTN